MKKLYSLLLLAPLMLSEIACTPLEQAAYRTVVGAKAFIDSEKAQHPECTASAASSTCQMLKQATSAKDELIDAVEVYCGSADFDAGKVCTPPAKGTPAAQVATDKLKAAIASYNQIYADMKGSL